MTNHEIAISAASAVCGLPKKAILSGSRQWPAVEARMLIVLVLKREGHSDERISWVLNRKRGAILKNRHNGEAYLEYSNVFRAKYEKMIDLYDRKKSLRAS